MRDISDFSEEGTRKRREIERQLIGIVANVVSSGPVTAEEVEARTGLSETATRLGLNLMHMQGLCLRNGQTWYYQNPKK